MCRADMSISTCPHARLSSRLWHDLTPVPRAVLWPLVFHLLKLLTLKYPRCSHVPPSLTPHTPAPCWAPRDWPVHSSRRPLHKAPPCPLLHPGASAHALCLRCSWLDPIRSHSPRPRGAPPMPPQRCPGDTRVLVTQPSLQAAPLITRYCSAADCFFFALNLPLRRHYRLRAPVPLPNP